MTFRMFAASGALILAACATQQAPVNARSVTIERTEFHVAHITASNYESLAYGTAYAYAQDNACALEDQMLTARGQRSKYHPTESQGFLGLRSMPNAQIDLFIQAHMDDKALEASYSQISDDAKSAMRGYVTGFNRYLQDVGPAGLEGSCRGAPWISEMTMGDLRRMNEVSMIQVGVGLFADAVVAARPPRPSVSAVPALAGADLHAVLEAGQSIGSNGWAFGDELTSTKTGLLLGNPHFPWVGPNRFWQVHLTIPGVLDVMGAAIGPSPAVQIGFNHDVAWTHTVSTGKRFTVHELTLLPGDVTSYVVDGNVMKMTSTDFNVGGRSTTLWSSVWGPIIVLPRAGLTWTKTHAYAIKDANTLNARSVDAWMAMNRAKNVEELRQAMGNQGIPWVNTLAADRAGAVLYADLSSVPDVAANDLQRCKPSPVAATLLTDAGIVVLDGSRKACGWRLDPTATAPGLIPASRMPVAVRRDYVQNSNDSFWLSNPTISWPAISPLVGLTDTAQGLRTRMALLEIRHQLTGTIGSVTKMDAADVEAILFSDRNLAGRLVADDMLQACRDATTDLQKESCSVIGRWDRSSGLDSPGAALFREFWRRAREIKTVWRVPFDAANPIDTPTGLNLSDAAVKISVLQSLQAAASALRDAGFALDVKLRVAQTKSTSQGTISVPGGEEIEGVLNKTQGPGLTPKGYDVNYGSSYIQLVTFDSEGPVAKGMLTYGQVSNLASPFAYDQLEAFSRSAWPSIPFKRADIERHRQGAALVLTRE